MKLMNILSVVIAQLLGNQQINECRDVREVDDSVTIGIRLFLKSACSQDIDEERNVGKVDHTVPVYISPQDSFEFESANVYRAAENAVEPCCPLVIGQRIAVGIDRKRVVTRVNRWATRQQRVRHRRAAIVGQRSVVDRQ